MPACRGGSCPHTRSHDARLHGHVVLPGHDSREGMPIAAESGCGQRAASKPYTSGMAGRLRLPMAARASYRTEE